MKGIRKAARKVSDGSTRNESGKAPVPGLPVCSAAAPSCARRVRSPARAERPVRPELELTTIEKAALMQETKHCYETIERFRRGKKMARGTLVRIEEAMAKLKIVRREKGKRPRVEDVARVA
jgi:hypothetical protein